MKKSIFLLVTVLTINAHAQLNLKWSQMHSLSGGVYKSQPVNMITDASGNICVASNEYYEASEDSVKGMVTKYDADGNLQWSTVLSPAVSLASFPGGGISSFYRTDTLYVFIVYNTDLATSHLIKINSNGTIAWDIIVNGMNNISSIVNDDNATVTLVGRTPQFNCGGFACSGIAIAKYDTNGQEIWTRTRYTTNLRTRSSAGFVDNDGTLSVCGKKAPASSANYNQTFVLKYTTDGTLLWEKVFNGNTTEAAKQDMIVDASNNIYFATADGNAVKLRKLSGANGALQWTKTINNSELTQSLCAGAVQDSLIVIATNTGMRCYNAAGAIQWSNSFIVEHFSTSPDDVYIWANATNVSAQEPLSNFLVQLNAATGTVLYQKNLSFGNHEEYMGEFAGFCASELDVFFINDNTAPYGTRVTKLSPCSEFTFSYLSSTATVNVSNAGCNNGEITVTLPGPFNSWPHIELWKGATKISEADPASSPHVFQNLSAANYTVKVFDESCGEQDLNVTVKCPVPTGLNTTNITRNKARLNWTLPSCNSGVQLQYRLQGAPAWTIVNTTASYKQLSGLTLNSIYEWQVASKCTGSNPAVYSDYSAIQVFSTSSQLLEDPEITIDDTEEIKQDISSNPGKENARSGFNIYPNPSDGNFIVSVNLSDDNGGDRIIRIINSSGQVVKKLNMNGQNRISMNLKEAGTYSVQLITNRQVITKKLIVLH